MKITLVRHGEIDNNYLGAYNGHNDISLSKKGYKQAEALAEHFRDKNFDLYLCSDLLRAKQTFAPFNKEAIYTSKLREKSWGIHEGMKFEDICLEYNLKYENFQQWIDVLDGESYIEFIERVREYFFDYLLKQDYKNIFVMTHSGVIKVLIHLVNKISLEEAFSIKIPYSSYVIFDTKINKIVIN